MERYNLRSGSLVNPVVSSNSRIQDWGQTEGNRLTDLAAGNVARLTAEENAPNFVGSGEISSPSKTREKETFQTKEVCEPVKSSGVRGGIMVSELLIPTLTETLPVLSPGTVSTILGENWETGREQEQPPVLHPFHVTPPLSAAYAIRGSSTFTPMQSQTILQPEFSPQTSQTERPPNTLSQHWTSVSVQPHRHTTTQLANSLLCHPTWFHTIRSPPTPVWFLP